MPEVAQLSDVPQQRETIFHDDSCATVERLFSQRPSLKGLIIQHRGDLSYYGAVSRHAFFSMLGSAFGRDLNLGKSIWFACLHNPELAIGLKLPEDTPIDKAVALAIERPANTKYEPILVISNDGNQAGLIDVDEILWRLLKETESLNRQLAKANRDKNEMLGVASHDLKNPLSVIISMSELLESNELDPATNKDLLKRIQSSAKKMIGTISTFIDASRVEGDLFNPQATLFPLRQTLQECMETHRSNAENKQQYFECQCDDLATTEMYSDKSHMVCVIDNIVSNAIKYSPLGGNIQVQCQCDADNLYVNVTDSGPGISEEDQKNLFRKFTRLSAKPTGGESSTGLGLFTVRKIVKGLKGKITLESSLGQGSTFKLRLPLAI